MDYGLNGMIFYNLELSFTAHAMEKKQKKNIQSPGMVKR